MALRFESHAEPIPGYRLIERIGSGGFGEVWKAEAPGGIFKAVKIIHGDLRSRDNDLVRYAEQELKALKRVKSVRHPYLLALDRYDIIEGRLLIVMELADCNLWDRFRECRQEGHRGIPRDELLQYMDETAEVLDLMNDRFQLQHLDIKPQNLFLLYHHVKVADFGQVKDLQGLMASVTGGITPVYAAPETFDGFVSRFCDQYSLACVYQELLTGVRPFDGSSMQQLLMQHLQLPPNLSPSPEGDRPVLLRALAKKPEDRFPNIKTMVDALRQGHRQPSREVVLQPAALPAEDPGKPMDPDRTLHARLVPAAIGELNAVPARMIETPAPLAPEQTPAPYQPAIPETTGAGCLRPTILIGIGHHGMQVLQHLRKHLNEQYGPPEWLPALRFLYIDSDPGSLEQALVDRSCEGYAPLREEEVYAAKLNRAAHYLKPRLNGCSLIDGWFDPQLLYKIPRNPVTMGQRAFGRLALCDHFRNISQKLDVELEVCTHPDALADTTEFTGLEMRSNYPRVFVVTGLGGGTGSGMFLDLAYLVRNKLQSLGYTQPEVHGVLFLPQDEQDEENSGQSWANAHAALTELHHFSRPDTQFQASYDDRLGTLQDSAAPFSSTVLLPGPVPLYNNKTPMGASTLGASGRISAGSVSRSGRVSSTVSRSGAAPSGAIRSGVYRSSTRTTGPNGGLAMARDGSRHGHDAIAMATDYLRLEVTTSVGRTLDPLRPPLQTMPAAVRTLGITKFDWPRGAIISRTAQFVSGAVIDHWVSPNYVRAHDQIPGWVQEHFVRLELDPDHLIDRLRSAADASLGHSVEAYAAQFLQPLIPKGWLTRLPSSNDVTLALAQLDKIFGTPIVTNLSSANLVTEAAQLAVQDMNAVSESELAAIIPGLIDDPAFRLAGAEETLRRMLATIDQTLGLFAQRTTRSELESRACYDMLLACSRPDRGGRKISSQEWLEAVELYPKAQYQVIILRHATSVYEHMKACLVGVLAEVSASRQRLETYRKSLISELEQSPGTVGRNQVMPPGCPTIEEAAQKFLSVLTDDDLTELEYSIQTAVEAQYGGLFQACLNATDGPSALLQIVRDQTRLYLNKRLGEVDFLSMLNAQFGSSAGIADALARGFRDAVPELVGPGAWTRHALTALGTPEGQTGEVLRELAEGVAPTEVTLHAVITPDELLIYREYPQVPLSAFPHCSHPWVQAYQNLLEQPLSTPHARTDITQWIPVDSTV